MTAAACNIGGPERTKRWVAGFVGLGLGIVLSLALIYFHTPWWTRILALGPFWLAGMGFFQARESVCVALAAKHTSNFGSGDQPVVTDPSLDRAIQTKARRIHRWAALCGLLLTAGLFLLP